MGTMNHMDSGQAAVALGVTRRRVQALIKSGRLPATKFGRDWMIAASDLEKVRERKPGRPRKAKAEQPPAVSPNGSSQAKKPVKAPRRRARTEK